MSRSTDPLGARRQCPSGADLRECRQPKRRTGVDRPSENLQFASRIDGAGLMVLRGQPTAKPSKALTYPPPKAPPQTPGRAVFGSREHARGRGIDGPPKDSPPPKVVERSAGRRRTIDSSPFYTQEKESPLPPRARPLGGVPVI